MMKRPLEIFEKDPFSFGIHHFSSLFQVISFKHGSKSKGSKIPMIFLYELSKISLRSSLSNRKPNQVSSCRMGSFSDGYFFVNGGGFPSPIASWGLCNQWAPPSMNPWRFHTYVHYGPWQIDTSEVCSPTEGTDGWTDGLTTPEVSGWLPWSETQAPCEDHSTLRCLDQRSNQRVMKNGTHFFGGSKQNKDRIVGDFPYKSALFGLVIQWSLSVFTGTKGPQFELPLALYQHISIKLFIRHC